MKAFRKLLVGLFSISFFSTFASHCSSSDKGDDDCRKAGCGADEVCSPCRGSETYICLPKDVVC